MKRRNEPAISDPCNIVHLLFCCCGVVERKSLYSLCCTRRGILLSGHWTLLVKSQKKRSQSFMHVQRVEAHDASLKDVESREVEIPFTKGYTDW